MHNIRATQGEERLRDRQISWSNQRSSLSILTLQMINSILPLYLFVWQHYLHYLEGNFSIRQVRITFFKKQRENRMVEEEPSHVKQLSSNHACKIGLKYIFSCESPGNVKKNLLTSSEAVAPVLALVCSPWVKASPLSKQMQKRLSENMGSK